MTESDPKAVAQQFIGALAQGDRDALRRLFADDVTWTFPGEFEFSGMHRGQQAVFEHFLDPAGALFDAGATPTVELHNLVAGGHLVALEFTTRTRTAAGNDYANDYVMIVDVADGRVQHVREYTDTEYLRTVCSL